MVVELLLAVVSDVLPEPVLPGLEDWTEVEPGPGPLLEPPTRRGVPIGSHGPNFRPYNPLMRECADFSGLRWVY